MGKAVHLVLRYAALKSGNPMPWIEHDDSSLYEQLNLMSKKMLHTRNDLCSMYKILNRMCNNAQVRGIFTQRVIHHGIRRPRILKKKVIVLAMDFIQRLLGLPGLEIFFIDRTGQ